jgi:hypothetical protein
MDHLDHLDHLDHPDHLDHRSSPVSLLRLAVGGILLLTGELGICQQVQPPAAIVLPAAYGPYSGHFLAGGRGLLKPLPAADPILSASAPWTLSAWVELPRDPGPPAGTLLVAGAGDPQAADSRFFALVDGEPALRFGRSEILTANRHYQPGWHLFAATLNGIVARFYVDGAKVAEGPLHAGPIKPELALAPVTVACAKAPCIHFGGRIALFTLGRDALAAERIATLAGQRPDFNLIDFEEGSKPWALQIVQFAGNTAPQDPSTLPHRQAPFSPPVVEPASSLDAHAPTHLEPAGDGAWTLAGGWKLQAAPAVSATAAQVAAAGFDTSGWLRATVPGTALTSMIADGLYPDPDYGLNNLAIPESLNKQDYWYRAEFATPSTPGRQHLRLVMDGINYHAEVWLNGQHLGAIAGAFMRGSFDVTRLLRPDQANALAVLVSPAPHPGIPNEQSIAFGAGLNGGAMAIDGPTFMATEGWDWFPPMRDRNTGIWQDVHLVATGPVALGDPQVISHLPLPDISQADVTLYLPLTNVSNMAVRGILTASFEGVTVHKQVTVEPGESTVKLAPAEFPQLHLEHPRLWWPNGYGAAELYHLSAEFATEGSSPVAVKLQFGVREVSYELSLLDNTGALRRVDYDPLIGRDQVSPQVDVTHEGMRQVPNGWAASFAAGQDASPVFKTVGDTRATPYLILRVNGVRIAARGGSWGMDDSRKRISREHLEPYFRFDRDANLNIIRNWQGQNTEEVFYQLADEYGMMVWNDFWEVTMDSNAEAEDPQLFLRNAEDTILRYRNHPSIVLWCGRNEGVPQPIINRGLIRLTHSLDGTRYYSPSSNQINLQTSGPYTYEEPADYYTTFDQGFAVEVGTPSLPTLEWFWRWLPEVDRWPISDDWAYHNWHPNDAFNQHLQAQFGVADSLEDYERKAQMMNYVDYRAIFEGFNAHLWAPNAGRLLWMTQPAWPSTLWGIISSDYDTQASFYATKKACEPVHVQLDLADNDVEVVNTTRETLRGVNVGADIYSMAGKLLQHRQASLDAEADDVIRALTLELAPLIGDGVIFVRLTLRAPDGSLLSENFYWRSASDAGYRALNSLGPASVSLAAELGSGPGERRIKVHLKNTGSVAALAAKLVLVNGDDNLQVLPAYYSDNYVSLLPGDQSNIFIDLPAGAAASRLKIRLRGWNIPKAVADVTQ